MQGGVLSDYALVKTLIAKTKTQQGLNVIVRLNLGQHDIGIKKLKSEVDDQRVSFDHRSPPTDLQDSHIALRSILFKFIRSMTLLTWLKEMIDAYHEKLDEPHCRLRSIK